VFFGIHAFDGDLEGFVLGVEEVGVVAKEVPKDLYRGWWWGKIR
jgi:hypothetical protein